MCTNAAITSESLMGLLHNQPWLFTASSFCPGDLSNYSLRRASTKQQGLIDSAGSSWWLLHLLFLWLPSAHHTPTALSCSVSRELQTAVKPCIMKLTLLPNPPPSLPLWFFSYIPLPACNPPSRLPKPTLLLLSPADAAELITVSFISRLAAQRDLGIDEMPADWRLLNRLLFTPMTQLRGWREERGREWEEEV